MTLSLPFSRHRQHEADYPPQDDETPAEQEARIARNILLGLSNDVRLEQADPNNQILRLLGHEARVLAHSEIVSPFLKAVTLSETAANLNAIETSSPHIVAIRSLAETVLTELSSSAGINPRDFRIAMNTTGPDRPFREAVEIAEDFRLLEEKQAADKLKRRGVPKPGLDATGEIGLIDKNSQ